jgi:hypothetical protein
MNEFLLTDFLVKNLRGGGINKIAKSQGKRVTVQREIGDGSFRADIFISLENLKSKSKDRVHFVAIEVKIKDWKQGLYQAHRYNSFAEKSYLALYEKFTEGVDIDLFKQYNVGLISFNESGMKILNRPKTNCFKFEKRSLELRKTLATKICLAECI